MNRLFLIGILGTVIGALVHAGGLAIPKYGYLTNHAVPLPCNYKWAAKNPLLRDCKVAIPDIMSKFTERAKIMVRGAKKGSHGGYYGGQLLAFYGAGASDYFPQIACDVQNNEKNNNQYGGSCGTVCSPYESGGAVHLPAASCQKEARWFRGSWIRNVSKQWYKFKTMTETASGGTNGGARGLEIRGISSTTTDRLQNSLDGITNSEESASSPCQGLADDYIQVLNRIRDSTIFNTSIGTLYAKLGPKDCQGVVDTHSAVQDTSKVAACELLAARNALEATFTYLLVCTQYSTAMDTHVNLVTQNGSKSIFQALQDNVHSTCHDILYTITPPYPGFSDGVNCYNSHVESEVRKLLNGKHGDASAFAQAWESSTGMPMIGWGE